MGKAIAGLIGVAGICAAFFLFAETGRAPDQAPHPPEDYWLTPEDGGPLSALGPQMAGTGADPHRSPQSGEHGPAADGRVRDFVRSAVGESDEAGVLEALLPRVKEETESSTESGPILTSEKGHFHALQKLAGDVEGHSILDGEGGEVRRTWNLLTKAAAVFYSDEVSATDKIRIGEAFLRLCGVREMNLPSGEVWSYAVQVQRLRFGVLEAREVHALLGCGLDPEQARGFAVRLQGLAGGQRRVETLARLLLQVEDLSSAESTLLREAFEESVTWKREILRELIRSDQLERLYDEKRYDSLDYWKSRIDS